jgi:hypothetical protein
MGIVLEVPSQLGKYIPELGKNKTHHIRLDAPDTTMKIIAAA